VAQGRAQGSARAARVSRSGCGLALPAPAGRAALRGRWRAAAGRLGALARAARVSTTQPPRGMISPALRTTRVAVMENQFDRRRRCAMWPGSAGAGPAESPGSIQPRRDHAGAAIWPTQLKQAGWGLLTAERYFRAIAQRRLLGEGPHRPAGAGHRASHHASVAWRAVRLLFHARKERPPPTTKIGGRSAGVGVTPEAGGRQPSSRHSHWLRAAGSARRPQACQCRQVAGVGQRNFQSRAAHGRHRVDRACRRRHCADVWRKNQRSLAGWRARR